MTRRARCSSAALLMLAFGFASSVLAATGSWSSQMPSVMVAMSDRASSSQAISPPAGVPLGSATLARVQWRFETPAHVPVNAWLCHPEQCVPLGSARGSTMALSGLSASEPLYMRFALSPGQRPVRVQGLQVIVNYQ
ncbi:flagellar protein FlhE [Vreelandella stevensii]|uniref:flagellar protein FlhE n=2 Tax=Oceanospirillales TaxID=135619 RepID=UPI001ED8E6A5|nr:flagellar protein FlhE [Halomonas stevensii]